MHPTGVRQGGQSPYLAREAELDRLRRRLEAARDGRGGMVAVRGPWGSGVTRTAHEIAAHADRLGMLVLWGSWLPGTVGRPYGALAEALEEYGLSLSPESLAAELAEWAAPVARIAPRLGGMLRELTPAAPLAARDERLRLQLAVGEWLARASARQPLLIVVDDAQWADGDSLRLLEHLVRRATRLPLLVLAGRDETPDLPEFAAVVAGDAVAEADWRRLEAEGLFDVVELDGIDEGATGALLATLADEPLTSDVVALIHAASGGVPLHSRELYRHLHEEDRLDALRGRGLPALAELPETFDDLVAWRAARLSPEVRAAMTALAAFDRPAPGELIAAAARLSRAGLAEFLEAAAARGLCRILDAGRRYALPHDRFRAALLGAISPLQRAHLHRRVAEAMEAELEGRTRESAGELVHHYALSAELEDGGRGVRHALVAAEQARAGYAHLRGAGCLVSGLALVAPHDHGLRAEIGTRLAQAHAEAGQPEEAIRVAAAAVQQQRQAGLRADEIVSSLVDTLRLLRGNGLDEPLTPGEELRRLALEHVGRARPEQRTRLELLGERWLELHVDRVRALFWEMARATLDLGPGDRPSESDSLELLLPQRPRTREQTAQAATFARSWRHPPAVLRALRAVSFDLVTRHGLFREGAGWAQLYADTAHRYGALREQVAALVLLARCQAVVGRPDHAADGLGQAGGLLEHVAEPGHLASELLLTRAVLAHYVDEDWAALTEQLEAAAAAAQPAGVALAAELAAARARAGSREAALELMPGLLDACAQLQPLAYYRDAALMAALTAAWEVGAGEHAPRGQALLALPAAAHVAAQPAATPGMARARLFALVGEVDEARSIFATERDSLDAAGLATLRAIVDHDEGVALAAAGATGHAEAARLLERAADQFTTLGMHGWRERTLELLARGFEGAAAPGGRLHFTYPHGLSRREAEVVRYLAGGATVGEAAAAMSVDTPAAERHLRSAMDKLGAASIEELPAAARRIGLSAAG